MKLADAYGVRRVRVHDADELEGALSDSLKIERPSLIEVPVGMMPNPFG
jgi:thiamine pyrophosphate-dependent acetolactate synthase large subunit-like protein